MIDRQSVAALGISASLLVGLALHEGYRGDAYIPVPGDVPTIGFGTTDGVKQGDKITPERALVRLLSDADKYAKAVKQCAPYPMYQNEFDAFVSLAYNVGPGAFCKSSIPKKLERGDYAAACKTILDFNKFQGKPNKGLTKRRQEEYQLCITNPDAAPSLDTGSVAYSGSGPTKE